MLKLEWTSVPLFEHFQHLHYAVPCIAQILLARMFAKTEPDTSPS